MASNDEHLFSTDAGQAPSPSEGADAVTAPPVSDGDADQAPQKPVKRAAKRAPRKRATATAGPATDTMATADSPDSSDTTSSPDSSDTASSQDASDAPTPGAAADDPSSNEVGSGANAAPAPAARTAKRAPRKRAAKKTAAAVEVAPTQEAPALEMPQMEPHAGSAGSAGAVDTPAPAADTQPETATADDRTATDIAAEAAVGIEADKEAQPAAPAAGPGFGLIFQAPQPTVAPRRSRRATAPAGSTDQPVHAEPSDAPEAVAPDQTGQEESRTADLAESDDSADGQRKRRRRGGKGRRARNGADDTADESTTTEDEQGAQQAAERERADRDGTERSRSDEAATEGRPGHGPESADATDGEGDEGAGSRRRTRRRRRSGSSGDEDDQPTTTTRLREPRKDRDEVTSVKGSTRLEAKKQRRREGREAGRRRTIITEAEFLARRESVERVMVVRHKDDRTQIGVLEDGVLVEHYVSRETNASMAGNVYLGRIQNVLPSMEAAFVDIGKGRNAVLYAGEVNWDAAGLESNRAKRIENALSSGDSVLVQVTKDPIGHKGARLTSQVSLPGRYLVYVPNSNMTGISRKLPDTERARLKKILREVVPDNAGVIVRTAAEGASEDELRNDVARLTAAWDDIQAKAKARSTNAPALLHGEPDLTVRVIRDVFNEDFAALVVAGDQAWDTVSGYVNSVAPDLADRVSRWTGEQDLFSHYRVDEQIAKAMDRKVWLPSGGSLVIDRTEAMTVVDVNTGKFVGSGGNLEETVTKNNIEAAEEIVRQLRLRDIGGIIVIDFIDMVLESNRDLVVRRLLECLGRDRTKHQVAEVTSLGLVQMTRKRVGAGLIEVFSENCEHCNGRGIIVHADPVDRPAGNGNGGGGGGNSGADAQGGGRSSRGRRGKGGRDATAPAPAAAAEPAPAPTGPTPAQIAAAAHAAAMHATPHPSTDEPQAQPDSKQPGAERAGQEQTAQEQTGQDQTGHEQSESQPAATGAAESLVTTEAPPTEPGAPEAAAAAPAGPGVSGADGSSSAQAAPTADAPTEAAPEAPAEAAPETSAQGTPATGQTTPTTRGRRKRGRVVAPAGPPRSHDDNATYATGAPAAEFGDRTADPVG